MKQKMLFYFGCIGGAGHYLHDIYGHVHEKTLGYKFPNDNCRFLGLLDAVYAPGTKQSEGEYQETNVGNFKIVAWWDRSVDKRPGSNSALVGIGYENAEEMLNDAYKQYPSVMNRQERPKSIL